MESDEPNETISQRRLADYKSGRLNMSKKIHTFLALVAVSCLLVTSVSLGTATAAAQRQAAGVPSSAAKNAAIVSTTAAVLKETSEIRELPILHPVKSGAQSRAEIERMVIRNLDEETTPAEMHASEVALKKLGLVGADFQYRTFMIKLLSEQVAGYYDPKLQEFFLADWIDLEGQKPVMAHELTHALQDQHFNLRRFEKWPRGDSDAELAAHALIEGDAVLAMNIYMAKNPLVALAFVRAMGSDRSNSKQFEQAPRALRESLVFPYLEGSEWATQLYKRGGWSAVTRAFKELPESTEQVLHPEKYFAHEPPVKVSLPDVGKLLGPRWKRIDYDVNGEWSYYLIIDQFLKSATESKRAAAGWGGDRYAIYEGQKPSEVLLAQMTVWDTENDAREFFDAYAKRTNLRYPDSKPAERVPDQSQASRKDWTTSEGRVVLELRGKRVLILEGVPEATKADDLATSFWQ
jgi:hypothetical protein